MATAAAGDAQTLPVRGYQYRFSLPIFKSDGTLITTGTGSGYVSADDGTAAAITPTFGAANAGGWYVNLTAAQMNGAKIHGYITSDATGASPTPFVVYTRKLGSIATGTAQAGASGTITLASGASAINGAYVNCRVGITSGAGSGAVRRITGYVGSTRVATVDANWGTTPDNTSVYEILPTAEATQVAAYRGQDLDYAPANAVQVGGTGQTARDLGASVLVGDKTGFSLATTPPTAAEVATAVWAAGARTLTSFGTLVADVWAAGSRTLTAISDSTGITTLLARLSDAWAAQVAAIKAKTDALPSDPASVADVEAVPAATAALVSGGGGTVAFTIRYVDGDGARVPDQGFAVRSSEGALLGAGKTDANGESPFSRNAGEVLSIVTVSRPGYEPEAPASYTVPASSGGVATVMLTVQDPGTPPTEGLCHVTGWWFLNGTAVSGAKVSANLTDPVKHGDLAIYSQAVTQATTAGNGLFTLDLVREKRYLITLPDGRTDDYTVPDAETDTLLI